MNVSLKKEDAASGVLKIEILKDDYAEPLEKSLRKLRQKVNLPGFRKGMVPLGMVKKLYGKQAMAEEVNKLVSEKLFEYIRDNKINILGEPIPNETEQKPVDFDKDEDFEFCFDIAIAPEIDIQLTKEDKLTYYRIKIDDGLVDKQVEAYQRNLGTYDSAGDVEEEDLVKGVIAELEGGEPKAGGILVEDAMLMPLYMKGKMEKNKFIGAKTGKKITFNPFKAFKGAEAELASLLKISKDKAKETKSDFTFEIKEITRHKKAELNQELFDRIFGEGSVKDEAAFREKVKDSLSEQYAPESEYKYIADIRSLLINKIGDVKFADGVLKRWLLASNEKTTEEMVEQDYPKVVDDLKYHLTKEKLVKDNGLKVEKGELENMAKRTTKAQFAQYGMLSVPDDLLEKYAKDMLGKKETVNNLVDRVIDEKLSVWIKDKITVETKEVSVEEFGRIARGENETETGSKEGKE